MLFPCNFVSIIALWRPPNISLKFYTLFFDTLNNSTLICSRLFEIFKIRFFSRTVGLWYVLLYVALTLLVYICAIYIYMNMDLTLRSTGSHLLPEIQIVLYFISLHLRSIVLSPHSLLCLHLRAYFWMRNDNMTTTSRAHITLFMGDDQSSIPGWVIPKTQKIVFDAALLNTPYYKVMIKSKVEQSRERSTTLPNTSVAIENGTFGPPSATVGQLTNV